MPGINKYQIRARLLKKLIEESSKEDALHALWRAIKRSVREHLNKDSLVEWHLVELEFDKLLEVSDFEELFNTEEETEENYQAAIQEDIENALEFAEEDY